jgi:hypothetical protein
MESGWLFGEQEINVNEAAFVTLSGNVKRVFLSTLLLLVHSDLSE